MASAMKACQQRRDTARIIHTMVPDLAPPLVTFCLDIAYGRDEDQDRPPLSRTVSASFSSPRWTAASPAAAAASRQRASLDVTPSPRFMLRRLGSEQDLLATSSRPSPLSSKRDGRGLGSRPEALVWDLYSAEPQAAPSATALR